MKNLIKHVCMIAAVALPFSVGLAGIGCGAVDNFNSAVACHDYCSKKFQCNNHDPSNDETDTCINGCRNSIENNCGNEHQAAANDQIAGCVDKSCVDFWACMVFDVAPVCYGFVSP